MHAGVWISAMFCGKRGQGNSRGDAGILAKQNDQIVNHMDTQKHQSAQAYVDAQTSPKCTSLRERPTNSFQQNAHMNTPFLLLLCSCCICSSVCWRQGLCSLPLQTAPPFCFFQNSTHNRPGQFSGTQRPLSANAQRRVGPGGSSAS